jgi:hypothetical protein
MAFFPDKEFKKADGKSWHRKVYTLQNQNVFKRIICLAHIPPCEVTDIFEEIEMEEAKFITYKKIHKALAIGCMYITEYLNCFYRR